MKGGRRRRRDAQIARTEEGAKEGKRTEPVRPNTPIVTQNRMDTCYLPGAASLVDHLDKRIAVLLQDGRNLIGFLRSYDQYMNLVLHDTIERLIFEGIAFSIDKQSPC
ncbi:hypothetical protein EON64_16425 [archaeon]|nr:MAG: hypothetical protein EON64_16425 [archaeon]